MKKCKNCKYRTSFSGGNANSSYGCQYILIAGHMRGCDIDNCTKYEYAKTAIPDPMSDNSRLFDVRRD